MRLPQPLPTLQVVERSEPVDDSPDLMVVQTAHPERGRLGLGDLDRHLTAISALIDGISPTVWIDYRGGYS